MLLKNIKVIVYSLLKFHITPPQLTNLIHTFSLATAKIIIAFQFKKVKKKIIKILTTIKKNGMLLLKGDNMKVSKSIAIDAEKLIKLQKISKEKGINLSKMIDFLIDKYFAELFAK